MRFEQWYERFAGSLLARDMPLITPVAHQDLNRLLHAYHAQGFTPTRVANMFNKRFQRALKGSADDTNNR